MKIIKIKFSALATLLLLSAFFSAYAQKPATPKFDSLTVKAASAVMGREMPYRVILPADYKKNKQKRYPVVYLLHGLTGHYDNWTENTRIVELAKKYPYIIVTPEGGDGWYTDSATISADKYESYFMQELVPEIDKKYRTLANRENRVVGGLSMGGYGAIKFGIKYRDKFIIAGSFSGALDSPVKGLKNNFLRPSIASVFGSEGSKTQTENDIFRLMEDMSAEKLKDLPFLYLSCGTEDFLYKANHEFAGVLQKKKIPHEYRELPGKHDWAFWDSQIEEFLMLVSRRVK